IDSRATGDRLNVDSLVYEIRHRFVRVLASPCHPSIVVVDENPSKRGNKDRQKKKIAVRLLRCSGGGPDRDVHRDRPLHHMPPLSFASSDEALAILQIQACDLEFLISHGHYSGETSGVSRRDKGSIYGCGNNEGH